MTPPLSYLPRIVLDIDQENYMTISDLQYWNQRDFAGLNLAGVDFSGYRLENAD